MTRVPELLAAGVNAAFGHDFSSQLLQIQTGDSNGLSR